MKHPALSFDNATSIKGMQKNQLNIRLLSSLYRLTGLRESRNTKWWNTITPQLSPHATISKSFDISEEFINDRLVWEISKSGNTSDRCIFYIPGNGFSRGMNKGNWRFVQNIAEHTRQNVIIPDLPRLPDADPNSMLYHIDKVFEYLISTRDADSITLFADSNGGAIAHSFCQMRIRDHKSQPGQMVLLSPWLDLTFSNPLIDDIEARDPVLNRAAIQQHARKYYGDFEPTDPLISPIYGDIRRVCSTTIFVGTHDICLADCKKLKLKADSEPVVFQFRAFEGLFHNWPMHFLQIGDEATSMVLSHIKHPPTETELSLSDDKDFWKVQ